MYHLFHGPDSFSRSEEIARLAAQVGDPGVIDLNVTTLDGHHVTLAELIHVCDTIPLLAERHLVIVEGLVSRLSPKAKGTDRKRRPLSAKDKKLLKDITEYLARLPETTELILTEDDMVDKSHALYKAAAKRQGAIKAFPMLKSGDLDRWIAQRAEKKGIRIAPQAVRELALYVGNDLRLLDLELEKLATYAAGQQVIRADDVHRLVSYVREESIFVLVDALGQRNGKRAIRLLHQFLDEGTKPLQLLAMITRQFRLITQAKDLATRRVPPVQMMPILELRHRFILDKILRQARNFGLERLKAIYRELQQIDARIKTGRIDGSLALDLFVAAVCAKRISRGTN